MSAPERMNAIDRAVREAHLAIKRGPVESCWWCRFAVTHMSDEDARRYLRPLRTPITDALRRFSSRDPDGQFTTPQKAQEARSRQKATTARLKEEVGARGRDAGLTGTFRG